MDWYRELVELRREFLGFCKGYRVSLVSGNTKTGYSDNHLHGSTWPKAEIEHKISLVEQKAKTSASYRRFYYSLLDFMQEHGKPTGGSCSDEVIQSCYWGDGNDKSKRPNGYCYCNHGNFVEGRKFFMSWMRLMFYRKNPSLAFKLLGREVDALIANGEVSEDKPFRINGQGDTEENWIYHLRKNFDGRQLMISGFTRSLSVFMRLQMNGFVRVALSIDKTIFLPERVNELRALKAINSHKLPIVYGPASEAWEVEAIEAHKLKVRVIFERHHGRRITKKAMEMEVSKAKACPTYHDKMKVDFEYQSGRLTEYERDLAFEENVRSCFSGCIKCHAVGSKEAEEVRKMDRFIDLMKYIGKREGA